MVRMNETSAPGGLAAWVAPRSYVTWSSQDSTVGTDTPDGSFHFGFENSNPGQSDMFEAHGTTIQHSPLGLDSWTRADGRRMQYVVAPSGKPVGFVTGGAWHSLLTDRLGSVRVVANSGGGISALYSYDPYGGFRAVGEWSDDAHANTIQYAGASYDTALGIYRMGARWYDPGLGRFTSPDPSAKETNPYLYAAGNPINNTDPTGFSWQSSIAGAVAGRAVGALIVGSGAFACAATAGVGCAVGMALATATLGAAAGGLAGAAVGQRGDDLRDDMIGGAVGAVSLG